MKLYTIARDKELYDAKCQCNDGRVVVEKGSHINRNVNPLFAASKAVKNYLKDDSLFDANNNLTHNIEFSNLSAAASFVTGRIANGNIVWKTENGKAVKYSKQGGE